MASEPRRRLLIGLAAACIGIILARPAVGGNDLALDQWLSQRTTIETFTQHLHPLAQHRMADVMLLRSEGKYLVLRTPLSNIAAEQQMRVSIDGMPGTGTISLDRGDEREGVIEPLAFTLQFVAFPSPKQVDTLNLTQNPSTHTMQILKVVQTMGGPMREVMFLQRRPSPGGGTGFVQLTVTDQRLQGAAPEQLNIASTDFFSFLREHPAEAELYLRPLFRDFQQDAVFAPDPVTAWQMFSELWQPEPKIARQVDQILPQLDAADYHLRAAAQAKLQALGRDGAAVLIHLDRKRLTPEQNARVDRALLPYAQLSAKEVDRLRRDAGFLLDCLYSDSLSLRTAAFDRLRALHPGLQFDVSAAEDAREAAVQTLRAQLVPPPTPVMH